MLEEDRRCRSAILLLISSSKSISMAERLDSMRRAIFSNKDEGLKMYGDEYGWGE